MRFLHLTEDQFVYLHELVSFASCRMVEGGSVHDAMVDYGHAFNTAAILRLVSQDVAAKLGEQL